MTEKEPSRILVVDDDESVRRSLAVVLKDQGYTVGVASSGREAISKSKASFYNLALVDLRLPDMDGIRLLTEMRETIPKMVKIIITGYPSLENAIEAVNRGADGYMVKPYNMDDLLRAIKESLQKQQDERKYSEEKVKEYIEKRGRELGRR